MVACIMHGLIKDDRYLLTFYLITIKLILQRIHTHFQAYFQVPVDFNGICNLSHGPLVPTFVLQSLTRLFVADKSASQGTIILHKDTKCRRGQSSGAPAKPRTAVAARARLLSTGTKQSGKAQEFKSKLELFLTMTEGK